MEARRFYVITGGTMVHVAPHFSLCAPAYGKVGYDIEHALEKALMLDAEARGVPANQTDHEVHLIRTKMAIGREPKLPGEQAVFKGAGIPYLETNEDLEKVIEYLIRQPETKAIVMAVAVCDWKPTRLETGAPDRWRRDAAIENLSYGGRGVPSGYHIGDFGKQEERLLTSEGAMEMRVEPSDKLIGKIREARKDIFLVGFKATTGQSEQEQYITGLGLLKGASCNLVLANDVHEHRNMVITPEEAKYHVTKNRAEAITGLCQMIVMRSELHFTRSTVVDGDPVPWDSDAIPENLRAVVDHCIKRGAYKPFKGKTVGHFATRGPKDGIIYTSRRKSNFNELAQDGLLRIDTVGDDQVIAHGAKPSVGGQSQRIIFDQQPDVVCIVHAHVPLRDDRDSLHEIPVRAQRPYECGSHECGRNASEGLTKTYGGIKAVMLDEHGPNICFSRDTDPDKVIEFIERYWDLEAKTGGPVSLEA